MDSGPNPSESQKSQLQDLPDERVVDYRYPFLYPSSEKIGITIALILIPILGYLVMNSGYVPGESGSPAGGMGWFSVVLLLALVPLALSGLAQYICSDPIFSLVVIALVAYFVACYITVRDIKSIVIGILFYLLLLSVVFKVFTFFYLPQVCN